MYTEGVRVKSLTAESISSLGLVAISSSRAVILMIFAAGTALSMVPLDFFGLALLAQLLFLLIQFRCFSVICFGIGMAACAIKVGLASSVSEPRRLKMEMLRRAIVLGWG